MSAGGRPFYKMTGSGNDFVFFDARRELVDDLEQVGPIRRLSARGTGIGADGVVFLAESPQADIALRYYNSDGSPASLCGNATLCTARLATMLGAVDPAGFTIQTGSGVLAARIRNGLPEFDLAPVVDVVPAFGAIQRLGNERAVGFAVAGIPHVVVLVDDVERVDVDGRGRFVRNAEALPEGANVNFVSRGAAGNWSLRTYERGVEGETLACGTGGVATAIMLASWGHAEGEVELLTRSGQPLRVALQGDSERWLPSLQGEGRLVFTGSLADLG